MVQVYAPASIGNIGIGFDTLGIAIDPIDNNFLGDCVSIKRSDVFSLKNTGFFYDQVPIQTEKNIVFQCWRKFCKILKKDDDLVDLKLEKNVPVSSGLGSSACSIVATLVAINHYYECPLNNDQLLKLMGEMESKISGSIHLDNVASCFLGGVRITFLNNNVSQLIPIFNDWVWIVAYPGTKISTLKSRVVLPKQYSREDCINHSQNLAGFVHACHTNQESLAIKCIMQQDIIAEPYRSKLLPVDLSLIKESLIQRGAISCGISGSGPTIFAVCSTKDVVNDVFDWLSSFYIQNDLGFVKVCKINKQGVRVVME